MIRLLRVDSSPMGENAISRLLTAEFVRLWMDSNPTGSVIKRDLMTTPMPVVSSAWVSINYTEEKARTQQQNQIFKQSKELIAELLDADECVLGMPMHNWGPPSNFKLWVDHIVTPATKSTWPLRDKRVTCMIAAGGVYSPGSRDASKNYLVPWLSTVFGALGAGEMRFIMADGTKEVNNTGRIDRATFLAPHLETIRALFRQERTQLRHESQSPVDSRHK